MGSGSKTELVTIERESRTPDGGGGAAVAWVAVGQVWCEVKYARAGEKRDRGALRETTVYKFIALTDEVEALGITATDRIMWDGAPYNIRERPRRLQRAAETELVAESGVAQ